MSNLGFYQQLTTIVKSVGGPQNAKRLMVTAAGGLIVVGGAGYAGGQKIFRAIKSKLEKRNALHATAGQSFAFTAAGETEGLQVRSGDEYKVLDRDGDTVIIEVIGNDNNPYVVPVEFLKSVSKYPAKES